MNKRGGLEFSVIEIFLAIVGFFILASIIGFTIKGCGNVYDLRKCHDSLFLESKLFEQISGAKGEAATTAKQWPATCQTQGPVEIKDTDPDVVMKKIANMMMQCYWSLGESGKGGFDPFKKNTFIGENKCFACYMIKIDNINIKSDDANMWLMTHNINDDPKQPTYWNYIRNFKQVSEDRDYSPNPVIDFITKWRSKENSALLPVMGDLTKDHYYAIVYLDTQFFSVVSEWFHALTTDLPKLKEYENDMIYMIEWDQGMKCQGYSYLLDTREETKT